MDKFCLNLTARAAVFEGVGKPSALREMSVPPLTDGEILVRVTACTLCGSDLHSFEGRRTVPTPAVLGHEILGRIEAFGPTAVRHDRLGRPLRVGDRVTWGIVANCGECFYCRRGLPQKCERAVKYGHEALRPGREWTGGLAEVCVLASCTALFALPDELSDEIACPANCATATVAAALEAAGELQDRRVLVFGAGMLGLTACAMARERGVERVICIDPDASRLKLAEAFGATHLGAPADLATLVAAATDGRGVDAALELSGSSAAFDGALPQLRLGGTLVLVGAVFPSPPVPVAADFIVRRNLSLRGVHNYAPEHLQAALEFLATARHYPFASLVSEWFPLAAADEAFKKARTPGVLRIGVRP